MNDDLEYRVWYEAKLVCPNPREHWQMTGSYESLRAEYDLLHACEVSDEDLIVLATKLQSIEGNNNMVLLTFFGVSLILGIIGAALLMLFGN